MTINKLNYNTMKPTLFFVLFIISGLLSTGTANAQRLLDKAMNKAKEKLEQKAEEKIEEKIDQKIDEEIDKFEQQNKKEQEERNANRETSDEKSQRRMQSIMKGMGMSGEPVPIDDQYTFSTRIQMHLETIDGKGKKTSEGEFITYMNPKEANFAYEVVSGDVGNKGTGIFILDFKNKASIILSEEAGKKTGLVYGLNFMIDQEEAVEEFKQEEVETTEFTTLNPYISKTGKTKTIQGYKCEEFHYKNPEEKQEAWYWITKDLSVKTHDYFGAIFNAAAFSTGMGWGYLMESESLDLESGERSKMQVTDLSTSAGKKFSLAEYQVTNIGSFTVPQE
jgi:hypothetical protein